VQYVADGEYPMVPAVPCLSLCRGDPSPAVLPELYASPLQTVWYSLVPQGYPVSQ